MANEKPTNARLQMKHDIEANWIIAGNATNPFVPKPGELIIYDVDDSHDSPRIKIGDGDNNVNELPFFVDETKADKSELVQSDWDQNNSATLDYIKNRPFYTEDPTKVVIVEEETLTVGSDLYVECQFFPFEIGNTYFVTFNGTEYECVAWSDPNYEAGKTVCVGNGTFLGSDGYGDDLPFVIESYPVWGKVTYLNVGETGDYILSVSETQPIVHQIDIKYVPHDDTKMNVENPVCTGTFSMNRQKDSPIGSNSFVEGGGGSASGICSHAEGLATIATGNYSHAQGLYNIEDTENKYAHIVGNGGGHLGVYTRSNAHTLDWNGNAWFAGDIYVGSTSGKNKDEGSKKLVTEAELASLIAQITEAVSQKSQVQIITWEADD